MTSLSKIKSTLALLSVSSVKRVLVSEVIYTKYSGLYDLVLEQQEEVTMRHYDNAIFYRKSDLYGLPMYRHTDMEGCGAMWRCVIQVGDAKHVERYGAETLKNHRNDKSSQVLAAVSQIITRTPATGVVC